MTTTQTYPRVCCPCCGNENVVILHSRLGVPKSELKGVAIECHECLRGATFTWKQLAEQRHKLSA